MNIKAISSKLKGNPTMVEGTVYSMLVICSISHFLNDMIQSIIPAIYPIMKDKFNYSFAQIGIITLVFQMTSSILQPFTGFYADKHPRPYALSVGMCFTLIGLLLLALAENYFIILLAVSVVGFGSSLFSPYSLTCHTTGLGRQKEFGTVHIPGGRQWRFGCWPVACCHHYSALRTACHLLVCLGGIVSGYHHDTVGNLV